MRKLLLVVVGGLFLWQPATAQDSFSKPATAAEIKELKEYPPNWEKVISSTYKFAELELQIAQFFPKGLDELEFTCDDQCDVLRIMTAQFLTPANKFIKLTKLVENSEVKLNWKYVVNPCVMGDGNKLYLRSWKPYESALVPITDLGAGLFHTKEAPGRHWDTYPEPVEAELLAAIEAEGGVKWKNKVLDDPGNWYPIITEVVLDIEVVVNGKTTATYGISFSLQL